MRTALTLLAVAAILFFPGCAKEESGSNPSGTPSTDTMKKTMDDATKTADDAMKEAAGTEITYHCSSCDKEKTQAADLPPPS